MTPRPPRGARLAAVPIRSELPAGPRGLTESDLFRAYGLEPADARTPAAGAAATPVPGRPSRSHRFTEEENRV